MKNQVVCGLIALFVTLGNNVFAQTTNFQFRRLDVKNGLSHNEATSFLKDRKGFLWIGTVYGLNRFDGHAIKQFLNRPNDPSSISDNIISDLFETPDGLIVVNTNAGWNIYDPKTEAFSSDLTPFYQGHHIPKGKIQRVITDPDRDLWLIHDANSLIKIDAKQSKTHVFKPTSEKSLIRTDTVSSYCSGDKNRGWIIYQNGVLEEIEFVGDHYNVVYRNDFLLKRNNGQLFDYRIIVDADNDVWIFLQNSPQGVYFFNKTDQTFTRLHQQSPRGRLNSNFIRGIAQSQNKLIWVATDHGGVNIIDKSTFDVQYILHRAEDERSIGQNSLNLIYRDHEGIIWLGTFKKGVSYYHENLIRFPVYKHYPLATTGLPFSDVNKFAEDEFGNLWIGTNGGGLLYFDRKKNTFKRFLHNPSDPNSISSNVIVSLYIDHEKKLWIGTYYAGLNVYDGKKFTRINHDPAKPEGISDVNIWEIFEDSRKRLWIGTLFGGVNLFDRSTNTFIHYKQDDINSVKSNYVASIAEDKKGNLWFGTANGLDMLDRVSGRFTHFHWGQNGQGGISDRYVLDIKEDSRGNLWVATRNGLNLYNKQARSFKTFYETDGLPHNTILAILEDNQGTIWLSTPNGLSNLITKEDKSDTSFQFKNYDEADGLQGKQFNENAALKTKKGELIFGGADGFNIFSPEALGVNKNPPQVVLTNFYLYNKKVSPGQEIDGEVLLPLSITEASKITLPPGQNVFSIEFAGINFFNAEKNQYEYKLEGFHKEWLPADSKSRNVTFTNLNPGDYTLRVKASNNDGIWNHDGATLKIKVLPPFWKTRTAFVLYLVLIVSALLLVRKLIQERERMKFEREQERKETMRMLELDTMKTNFFTNVSHEFRTPLTLIITPLERLLRQAKDPALQEQYQLIQRNAKRVLNLVNQLLDFKKLEVQELKLAPSQGDIIQFIEETVYSFSDISEKKDIKLSFHSSIKSLETLFDQDKLEKILFNLLSNAFKFTPEHGSVTVDTTVKDVGDGKNLVITVRDTGIGIEKDKLDKIFDRFFQNDVPKTMVNQGSGIGLSLTREFVKIHKGTIEVESQPGVGSCFIVTLPLPEVIDQHDYEDQLVREQVEEAEPKKPLILLVEDNQDFRSYLKDNLKLEYKIIEAPNGREGWRMTVESLPDLIVSDIMMPEMNGIELCKRIKSDQRVSHTPVILLTARSAEEQKLEGFESGADDYITKPFNFEILVSRIKNLIVKRQKLHKTFPTHLDIKATELKITSLDEQFISKAIKFVEDNISNADFSVEDLSHELGFSRAHFYKKLMSLTGKSPVEFIRLIRLQHAAQLLKKSQLTVAEVAYKVGFNNPRYFTRYFKEEYNVLPSVYASESKKDLP